MRSGGVVAHPAVTQNFKGNIMALSRTEIQKRSDEKRGIVQKNFKLPSETVESIKAEAEKRGIPQAALIALAVKSLVEA